MLDNVGVVVAMVTMVILAFTIVLLKVRYTRLTTGTVEHP